MPLFTSLLKALLWMLFLARVSRIKKDTEILQRKAMQAVQVSENKLWYKTGGAQTAQLAGEKTEACPDLSENSS